MDDDSSDDGGPPDDDTSSSTSSGSETTDSSGWLCGTCASTSVLPAASTCTLFQSCTTTDDCVPSLNAEYDCEQGRCIPSERFCSGDADCWAWCREVYGELADSVCGELLVPHCEAESCEGSGRRCVLLQSCSTSEECTNSWLSEHDCASGRCVPRDRYCEDDDDCRRWCHEFYGSAANDFCNATQVLRCQVDACGPGMNRCTAYQRCTTTADCTDALTTKHECIDGQCVPSTRSCNSDANCRDWCYDAYSSAASTFCDDTYVPKCE